MKCHLTIGPSRLIPVVDSVGEVRRFEFDAPEPRDCIGSECSAWHRTEDGRGFCGLVVAKETGGYWTPAATWPDPAAKKETP